MFQSLRYNIYFFLILLGAVFSLWLVNFSGNQAIDKQQHIHARIVKLNSQFSHFILLEREVLGNSKKFKDVFAQQKVFFRQCTACHSLKTALPEQRLATLTRKQNTLLRIDELRQEIQRSLSSLYDSVHYIHEHHLVTLQNYVQYTRVENKQPVADAMRRVYAEEVAREPDIIRQAVEIQHQLASIINDFSTLASVDAPEQVLQAFKEHISRFFQSVTTFEEYSLDAQDGLLVEELLESGRAFDHIFLELIDLETASRNLSSQLATNRDKFDAAFIRLEAALQQHQDALMKRMGAINWFILLLVVCLTLAFVMRARSLVQTVDTLVKETKRITEDISYQIPEQSQPLSEFTVLRTALNTMAAELNLKVEALTEENHNRRRMEMLLSQGKKEWERTFDAVPDMIFILAPDASILRANKAMLELLDLSSEQITGRKCYEVVHHKTTFPSFCNLYAPHTDIKDFVPPLYQQHEFYESRFNRHFSALMSPLYSDDGELTGYVHLMRDITEQKKAEQEKQNYALYLDSILSSSSHTAIVATDPDLCIKYFNPEAERIFQVRAADVLGLHIHEVHETLIVKATAGRREKPITSESVGHILQTLRAGEVHHFSFTYGAVSIDARLSVITNPAGDSSGFLLMASDITDKVQADKQQEVMAQRLVKAEKMEAIGLMAGGVAHDLNNILSGIINYPEMMLLQMGGDNKWKKALETIRDSGMRAAAIVADLLTIARGVACEKKIISVNEIVRQYRRSPEFHKLEARYPEVTVTTELAPDLYSCCCSPVHIQKILMNLVANGFEAISDRGVVTLTTSNAFVDSSRAEENKISSGNYVQITITDNGKGITEEDSRHMFEPFYSTKEMGHSGTGLGLAVVWNTVHDHKGAITVAGDGPGTTFTILLPAVDPETAGTEKKTETTPERGSGTVLVVDDEPLQRDVARQMLQMLGYEVATAANGREAVKYVQNQEVDLIILDMIMEPDMNGRQTLEEILKIRPEQKTLIASGYADSSEVKRACTLGSTALMNKPYTLQKLSESVVVALAS